MLDVGPSGRGASYYMTFRKCPRLFAYRYRMPRFGAVEEKRAPGLGSLVHALLARHYNVRCGVAQPTIEDIAIEVAGQRGLSNDDVELALAIAAHYATSFAAGMKPVAVEQEYRIGFVPNADGSITAIPWPPGELPPPAAPQPGVPIPYTARVDLVVEDDQQRIWYVDHKTTVFIRGDPRFRYALSGQIHGLWWIGYVHDGARFAGVKLTAIQTAKDQRRVDPPLPPPAAPNMIEDFPWLIVVTAREIAQWDACAGLNERWWPTTSAPEVCVGPWGKCDYVDRCMTGVSL